MKLKGETKEFLELLSRMEYNPSVEGRMMDRYPKLRRVVIFNAVPPTFKILGLTGGTGVYNQFNETECDILFRFVVLFADSQSPYAEEKDLEEKIEQCLDCLNCKKNSIVYKEVMAQGDLFRAYLYEYFKKIHSIQYEAWLALKLNFHNCSKVLRTPLSEDAEEKTVNLRRQLSKDIPNMQKELADLEYKLFQDPRLLKLINETAMENAIGGYAERHAETIEQWLNPS